MTARIPGSALCAAVSFAILFFFCPAPADAGPVKLDYTGHWYEAFYTPAGISWQGADTAATAKGGYLATIHGPLENNFVFGLVNDPKFWLEDAAGNYQGPFLGGRQIITAGTPSPSSGWGWVTAEAFSWANWDPSTPNQVPPDGEPNDGGDNVENGEEDYLQYFNAILRVNGVPQEPIVPQSTWNDIPGSPYSGVYGYVVEWDSTPPGVVPLPSAVWLGLIGFGLLGKVRNR